MGDPVGNYYNKDIIILLTVSTMVNASCPGDWGGRSGGDLMLLYARGRGSFLFSDSGYMFVYEPDNGASSQSLSLFRH